IVSAFLLTHALKTAGWISPNAEIAFSHLVMFAGAVGIGVFSAVLTEWIHQLGRVEASAALGVVFTTFFALGLLLIRLAADSVDIDPECVFYGRIDMVVLSTVGKTDIPQAAITNAIVLAVNGLLVIIFFKELRISTFDQGLSTAMGINAKVMNYALMAVTAATLVAAFESVGSILVIAMLIVPAATAYLLTDRLGVMIVLSLVFAAASAVFGRVGAITLPPIIFSRLGFSDISDVNTAGMMAVAAGGFFVLSLLAGPRYGIVSKAVNRIRLTVRIVAEDLLGLFYRLEEAGMKTEMTQAPRLLSQAVGVGPVLTRLALWRLTRKGRVKVDAAGYHLTDAGRESARRLVRSHRLWESYLGRHFNLPDDHLHEPASRVEHYIDPQLREELAAELDRPARDPHGREIPAEEGERE
ncbi:MAG: metal ABC transporter permease, partial [Planctomycetaceae bacterium]